MVEFLNRTNNSKNFKEKYFWSQIHLKFSNSKFESYFKEF